MYDERHFNNEWTWNFPSYQKSTIENLFSDYHQLDKIQEELNEAKHAYSILCAKRGNSSDKAVDYFDYICEIMDIMHACETLLRHIDVDTVGFGYDYYLTKLKQEVIQKNGKRGYYG